MSADKYHIDTEVDGIDINEVGDGASEEEEDIVDSAVFDNENNNFPGMPEEEEKVEDVILPGVKIVITVEDVTKNDREQNLMNTREEIIDLTDEYMDDEKVIISDNSQDYEEPTSVSASDMVDSSEVEWEEVVMEDVEEIEDSIVPAIKSKLDVLDPIIPVSQAAFKERKKIENKHFEEKLKELDSVLDEDGLSAKVDIADWLAEYSQSSSNKEVKGNDSPEVVIEYVGAPNSSSDLQGNVKNLVERRVGVFGLWRPLEHGEQDMVQQRTDVADESFEEPVIKLVDCLDIEHAVTEEVVTSEMKTDKELSGYNNTGTKTAISVKREREEFIDKIAPAVDDTQLLQTRLRLPPGVSITRVAPPGPGTLPLGEVGGTKRQEMKVMVMQTQRKYQREKTINLEENDCKRIESSNFEDDHKKGRVKKKMKEAERKICESARVEVGNVPQYWIQVSLQWACFFKGRSCFSQARTASSSASPADSSWYLQDISSTLNTG